MAHMAAAFTLSGTVKRQHIKHGFRRPGKDRSRKPNAGICSVLRKEVAQHRRGRTAGDGSGEQQRQKLRRNMKHPAKGRKPYGNQFRRTRRTKQRNRGEEQQQRREQGNRCGQSIFCTAQKGVCASFPSEQKQNTQKQNQNGEEQICHCIPPSTVDFSAAADVSVLLRVLRVF